jgi:hypothetical protein
VETRGDVGSTKLAREALLLGPKKHRIFEMVTQRCVLDAALLLEQL